MEASPSSYPSLSTCHSPDLAAAVPLGNVQRRLTEIDDAHLAALREPHRCRSSAGRPPSGVEPIRSERSATCIVVGSFSQARLPNSSVARIYVLPYVCRMPAGIAVLEVLAEPTRRRILDALRAGERSVGALVEQVGMHQPGVSRHLKVLRDAGLVEVRRDAQRRLYRLRPEPLMELDAWLEPYRAEWAAQLDSLGRPLRRTSDRFPRIRRNTDERLPHFLL